MLAIVIALPWVLLWRVTTEDVARPAERPSL